MVDARWSMVDGRWLMADGWWLRSSRVQLVVALLPKEQWILARWGWGLGGLWELWGLGGLDSTRSEDVCGQQRRRWAREWTRVCSRAAAATAPTAADRTRVLAPNFVGGPSGEGEGGLVGHWRCSLIIALPVCVLSVRVYLPTAAADAAAATASDGAHCEKPR